MAALNNKMNALMFAACHGDIEYVSALQYDHLIAQFIFSKQEELLVWHVKLRFIGE